LNLGLAKVEFAAPRLMIGILARYGGSGFARVAVGDSGKQTTNFLDDYLVALLR
jgi:hypothetical protein